MVLVTVVQIAAYFTPLIDTPTSLFLYIKLDRISAGAGMSHLHFSIHWVNFCDRVQIHSGWL